MTDYVRDFGNGYKIQKVFANEENGTYGDIYDFKSIAESAHSDSKIISGYVVVCEATGLVPYECNDWNDCISEAILDYEKNVFPTLDEDIVLTTPAEPIIRANGYVRDEISFSVKSSWLQTFFGVDNKTQLEALLENSDTWDSAEIFEAAKGDPQYSVFLCEEEEIEEYTSSIVEESQKEQGREEAKAKETETITRITVPTPLGDIVVGVKTDSEYLGIFIDLKGDKVNDTFELNTVMLASVEYDPYKKAIQTIVYGDAEREDSSHLVEHENVEKPVSHEKASLDSIIATASTRTGGVCQNMSHSISDPER